jgi:hypothetical protein
MPFVHRSNSSALRAPIDCRGRSDAVLFAQPFLYGADARLKVAKPFDRAQRPTRVEYMSSPARA